MIKRLYVDNYRSLVNFEITFQELTLLLGPNGVGKTSVLDVISAVRLLLSGTTRLGERKDKELAKIVFPAASLTRWQARQIQVVELDLVLSGDPLRYRLEIEHDPAMRRARILTEKLESAGKPLFTFHQGEVQLYRDNHSAGPAFGANLMESALARVPPRNDNQRLTRFLDFMRKVLICGIYPAGLKFESDTEDPVLARDGSNFADWYRHLVQERQDLVQAFLDSLRQVIDGFQSIRLERVGLDTRAVQVMFEQYEKRFELRLDELSDGQRALIVLYALIQLAAGQGYTLFLDEPDNYVALAGIQPWLIQLADSCGEAVPQAVLCSHHPELINYLAIENGQVLRREVSGVTVTRPAHELMVAGGPELSEVIARGWEQ